MIEIEDVFEARIAAGGVMRSSVLKTSVLTPRFLKNGSMIRDTSLATGRRRSSQVGEA